MLPQRTPSLTLVAALDADGGIGADGSLPWRFSNDLKRFKQLTCTAPEGQLNALLMGRKTWYSLPKRPLPGRLNIVLSRQALALPPEVLLATSWQEAMAQCDARPTLFTRFVIGGASLYAKALEQSQACILELTRLHGRWPCDVHFPSFDNAFSLEWRSELEWEGTTAYHFERWTRG
ncbi:MAG: dihydrofolate reductase [Myxococcota bacterium]|jgi:dihydrofolate reductase|nr:dihydrofolate reductase [Myxococcota bacterium]